MIALLRIGSLFDKMWFKLIKGNLNTIWKTFFFYKCMLYCTCIRVHTPLMRYFLEAYKLRRGDIYAQAIISPPKLLIQRPKLLKRSPLQHTFPI